MKECEGDLALVEVHSRPSLCAQQEWRGKVVERPCSSEEGSSSARRPDEVGKAPRTPRVLKSPAHVGVGCSRATREFDKMEGEP